MANLMKGSISAHARIPIDVAGSAGVADLMGTADSTADSMDAARVTVVLAET
ncbi:hypothetical protein [Frankia casuarinae]|uniref:hypothetical protein n=1 Tax=Frankia casuarinae (strain DSM 45818 / CECT 9043 / HFP020203 / CcI3) TaxID=106370 RepID=UPI001ED92115|nr:hypothetical protein [Frankia casuarinae]